MLLFTRWLQRQKIFFLSSRNERQELSIWLEIIFQIRWLSTYLNSPSLDQANCFLNKHGGGNRKPQHSGGRGSWISVLGQPGLQSESPRAITLSGISSKHLSQWSRSHLVPPHFRPLHLHWLLSGSSNIKSQGCFLTKILLVYPLAPMFFFIEGGSTGLHWNSWLTWNSGQSSACLSLLNTLE